MPVKAARKKGAVKLKTKKNYTKKRIKRVLYVLALTLGAFLILSGYSVYKLVDRNLASALTPGEVTFDENTYPTVLYVIAENLTDTPIKIQRLQFKIFDIEGERVFTYEIPLDYEIDMPGRLGLEKLSNIFLVSELNNSGENDTLESGINTLETSLLPVFGLKAERYVVVDSKSAEHTDKFWGTGELPGLLDKEFISNLSTHMRSNFSFKEFLKIASFIRTLPSDRLIDNPYLSNYIMDTEVIDQEVRELMSLSPISKEGYSVAILNAAGKAGFAAFGARVVANNGGRVVAVNNSDEDIKQSVLITDLQDSISARKYASIFGIENVMTKSKAREFFRDTEIDRADIVVVLGFDLAETL